VKSSRHGDVSLPQFIGFRQLSLDNATLLGAPIFAGQTMDDALSAMYGDLELAVEKLKLLSPVMLSSSSNLVWEDPNFSISYVLHLAMAIQF